MCNIIHNPVCKRFDLLAFNSEVVPAPLSIKQRNETMADGVSCCRFVQPGCTFIHLLRPAPGIGRYQQVLRETRNATSKRELFVNSLATMCLCELLNWNLLMDREVHIDCCRRRDSRAETGRLKSLDFVKVAEQ